MILLLTARAKWEVNPTLATGHFVFLAGIFPLLGCFIMTETYQSNVPAIQQASRETPFPS